MKPVDYQEIVTLVTFSDRQANLTLRKAVRLVIEDIPENTAKQLSAFIERNNAPPIGPLSAIRELYDTPGLS